jgi:dihydroneopterin aldolase
VEGNTFKLIETVAEHVAGLIKEKFAVKQVKISVSKPHAVKNAGNVCIIINR